MSAPTVAHAPRVRDGWTTGRIADHAQRGLVLPWDQPCAVCRRPLGSREAYEARHTGFDGEDLHDACCCEAGPCSTQLDLEPGRSVGEPK